MESQRGYLEAEIGGKTDGILRGRERGKDRRDTEAEIGGKTDGIMKQRKRERQTGY